MPLYEEMEIKGQSAKPFGVVKVIAATACMVLCFKFLYTLTLLSGLTAVLAIFGAIKPENNFMHDAAGVSSILFSASTVFGAAGYLLAKERRKVVILIALGLSVFVPPSVGRLLDLFTS